MFNSKYYVITSVLGDGLITYIANFYQEDCYSLIGVDSLFEAVSLVRKEREFFCSFNHKIID
jgi:hypothetical protein